MYSHDGKIELSEFIRRMLEIPYLHRGRSWTGADCYGAVKIFYQEFRGIQLPDIVEEYDEEWVFSGNKNYFMENYHAYFNKIDKPAVGDVICFQRRIMHPKTKEKLIIADHAGIVLFNGKFIHCSRTIGMSVDRYSNEFFQRKLNGFYRYKNV